MGRRRSDTRRTPTGPAHLLEAAAPQDFGPGSPAAAFGQGITLDGRSDGENDTMGTTGVLLRAGNSSLPTTRGCGAEQARCRSWAGRAIARGKLPDDRRDGEGIRWRQLPSGAGTSSSRPERAGSRAFYSERQAPGRQDTKTKTTNYSHRTRRGERGCIRQPHRLYICNFIYFTFLLGTAAFTCPSYSQPAGTACHTPHPAESRACGRIRRGHAPSCPGKKNGMGVALLASPPPRSLAHQRNSVVEAGPYSAIVFGRLCGVGVTRSLGSRSSRRDLGVPQQGSTISQGEPPPGPLIPSPGLRRCSALMRPGPTGEAGAGASARTRRSPCVTSFVLNECAPPGPLNRHLLRSSSRAAAGAQGGSTSALAAEPRTLLHHREQQQSSGRSDGRARARCQASRYSPRRG